MRLNRAVASNDWLWPMLVALGAGLAFGVSYLAPVSHEGSDPADSLIVSQSLLEHHTIQLDAYMNSTDLPLNDMVRSHIYQIGEHYYSYFPVGPSVLSVPAVWLARLANFDMRVPEQNAFVQNLLSALICGLNLILIYHIGRCHLEPSSSLMIALVSTFGTTLISTLGTALWSFNYSTLFQFLALLLVARRGNHHWQRSHLAMLGAILFATYWCRPSAVPFIAVVLAQILFERPKSVLVVVAMVSFLFVCFVIFSRAEFGDSLPWYYSLARFESRDFSIATALYGHLFSPSRGLFIFSPFFLVVLFGAARPMWDFRENRPILLSVAGIGLQVLVASLATRWWGGYSFGPRLLTDALPLLVLLTILVWRWAKDTAPLIQRRLGAASYLLLALVGVLIHSYQGMYKIADLDWNGMNMPGSLHIDDHREYLFSWRYPQFLATPQSICQRNAEFVHTQLRSSAESRRAKFFELLTPYSIEETLHHTDGAENKRPGVAVFVGYSLPMESVRWFKCFAAGILFRLNDTDLNHTYELEIVAAAPTPRTMTVHVNDVPVGEIEIQNAFKSHRLVLPRALLIPGQVNAIELYMPESKWPPGAITSKTGLAFRQLRITNLNRHL